MESLFAGLYIGWSLTVLGPCPPGMTINHIDYDRKNNHLSNLEYAAPAANTAHSRGRRQIGIKLNMAKAREIRSLEELLRKRKSAGGFRHNEASRVEDSCPESAGPIRSGMLIAETTLPLQLVLAAVGL
ncbi:MAG: HNH endonuclease [Isosphaeraceae bacterium]